MYKLSPFTSLINSMHTNNIHFWSSIIYSLVQKGKVANEQFICNYRSTNIVKAIIHDAQIFVTQPVCAWLQDASDSLTSILSLNNSEIFWKCSPLSMRRQSLSNTYIVH